MTWECASCCFRLAGFATWVAVFTDASFWISKLASRTLSALNLARLSSFMDCEFILTYRTFMLINCGASSGLCLCIPIPTERVFARVGTIIRCGRAFQAARSAFITFCTLSFRVIIFFFAVANYASFCVIWVYYHFASFWTFQAIVEFFETFVAGGAGVCGVFCACLFSFGSARVPYRTIV